MPNQVICNKHEGCPVEKCPHRIPHSTTYELAQMAYKPMEIETFFDDTERICGEREPKERIAVICRPVEDEGLDFKDQDAVMAEKEHFGDKR